MTLLKWDDALSLGIDTVDGQHMEMLGIVNKLLSAIHEGKGEEVVGTVLRELREYTVYHFNEEEKYMREIGFPGLYEHHMEHERLKMMVKEFRREQYLSHKVDVNKVRDFMKGWLVNHILGYDMDIAKFLKDRN